MFGIGSTELLVILLVGLIVLGPKSLAGLSRTLGKIVGEFRRVSTDFQRTLNAEVAAEEQNAKMNQMSTSEQESYKQEKEEDALREAKLAERKQEALNKAAQAKKDKEDLENKVSLAKTTQDTNDASEKDLSPLEKALAKTKMEADAFEAKQSANPTANQKS